MLCKKVTRHKSQVKLLATYNACLPQAGTKYDVRNRSFYKNKSGFPYDKPHPSGAPESTTHPYRSHRKFFLQIDNYPMSLPLPSILFWNATRNKSYQTLWCGEVTFYSYRPTSRLLCSDNSVLLPGQGQVCRILVQKF